MLPAALAPLAEWRQFVVWSLVPSADRPGKFDKLPFQAANGEMASHSNPAHWCDYATARRAADADPRRFQGVGFVFAATDPFYFLDIDGAFEEPGGWSGLAQELCARLGGAAVEVSSSGRGLHIIGSCQKDFAHRCRNVPLRLELYTTNRFVALTGAQAAGSVLAAGGEALSSVVAQYFDPADVAGGRAAEWTDGPCPEWRGPADDGELIRRALARDERAAGAVFGGGTGGDVTFTALWVGDFDTIGRKWPASRAGDVCDRSSADQALANHLAFWTGRDCERMRRLMLLSQLARGKWDDRPEYLEGTIVKACGFVRQVYQAPDAPSEQIAPPVSSEDVQGAGLVPRAAGVRGVMLVTEQAEHFAGCTYITSLNKVLTPRGARLDQGRFDVVFGGYEFVVDYDGKKSTTSAWEAFTRSRVFTTPVADTLCFRPEVPPGTIVREGGWTLANIYVPIETAATPGDPSMFLDHLAKMLPNVRDREILLTWMASVIRNPGMKAQWWPVVQGGEGNGKTYLLMIMRHCVGAQYSHLPNMDKMVRGGMNFNGWIEGKLFLGLEEVYAADRRQFFEGFKTTVTNLNIPIEAKTVEEVTGDNRANGIITTNHKDGVPISGVSRRYAPLFTAQQSRADAARDGMTDAYFARMRDWFNGRGPWLSEGPAYGFRVVNHYLRTRPLVAEYDPNQLAIWAPATSCIEEAIDASRGRAEQEVLEAIEEGRPGFAGGWVGSRMLDTLLDGTRCNVPRSKRRELMNALGYDWHPALVQGRSNNAVQPDGAKSRLFVKMGSIAALNLKDPADVARAYSKAQADAASGAIFAVAPPGQAR